MLLTNKYKMYSSLEINDLNLILIVNFSVKIFNNDN